MYNYIHRTNVFKKRERKNNIKLRKKKNIENYIRFCENLVFDEEYEKAITYLITDGEYVKIGQSKKPKKRLLTFQPYNPRKLTLLAVFEHISESKAHSLFSNKHTNGEWYKFDLETILQIELLKKRRLYE